MQEEEVAAAEMKRRHTVTRALLPIVAILTLLTMISFLSLCILNASSLLMDLDVTLEATRSRFVFTLASCILVCTLLDYYFHPLESKEMRVLMVSLIMMTISVCHILLLRNVSDHTVANSRFSRLNQLFVLLPRLRAMPSRGRRKLCPQPEMIQYHSASGTAQLRQVLSKHAV